VIASAFRVSNDLGSGYLEKACEDALAFENRAASLKVVQQARVQDSYQGIVVGDFNAELRGEDCILVDLEAVKALVGSNGSCINCLKATNLPICR
jgi:GxxExxY protein